jgi:hypothetical protein
MLMITLKYSDFNFTMLDRPVCYLCPLPPVARFLVLFYCPLQGRVAVGLFSFANLWLNFKEILLNRLSLTWGCPEVLSMDLIVSNIEHVGLTWALLFVPITWISSANQWMRLSFLLTSDSHWSVLWYIEENKTEERGGGQAEARA